MTIAKTTLIALFAAAAGSASAFACGNQINASVKERMPTGSTTQASLQPASETTTVASVERNAPDATAATE